MTTQHNTFNRTRVYLDRLLRTPKKTVKIENPGIYRGLGVETDYIHFSKKLSYIHFPSVKQPYFACTKPLHPISN